MEKDQFLETYVSMASEITDAPIVFHEFMAYALVSALTKGKFYLKTGDSNIHPNLYLILIAPSSNFRKSTSLMIAINILRKLDAHIILPNEFSLESILSAISNNMESGVNAGVFYYNEFKTLLGLLKRDYMSGGNAFFTEVYDCFPGYRRKIKDQEYTIERPFINIWGATTMEWFAGSVKEDDISSGFLARFLYIMADKKIKDMPFPPPINHEKRDAIVKHLEELIKMGNGNKGVEMVFRNEAKDRYIEFYKKNNARAEVSEHGQQCIYSRMGTYVLKFAMLNALMKLRLDITKDDMEKAIGMINFVLKNIEYILENEIHYNKFSQNKQKVYALIKARGQAGIARSDLSNRSHLDRKELKDVVDVLIDEDKIDVKEEKTSTKMRVIYSIAQKKDELP
jgi:hypothetical protein